MHLKKMYEIQFRVDRLMKDVQRKDVSDFTVFGQLIKVWDMGLEADHIHSICDRISRNRPRLVSLMEEAKNIAEPEAFRLFLASAHKLVIQE